MSARWIGLALCAALIAACSASKQTPAEAELDRALGASGAKALAGGTRLKKFGGRVIREETEHGFIAMLDADTCYAIVGVSAAGVREMSITVSAPSGAHAGRTRVRAGDAVVGVCAKMTGPYRVALELAGHGDFAVGVFGPPPRAPGAASASSEPAPIASAAGASSVAPLPPPTSVAPRSGPACKSLGSLDPFQRVVLGADRSCSVDAECIAVKLDCSHLSCAGVQRDRRAAYAAPIDCRGYSGPVGNYDCDPQFGIEAPRCRDGCCVSERVAP